MHAGHQILTLTQAAESLRVNFVNRYFSLIRFTVQKVSVRLVFL
jgi:hypothetical protein